MLATITASAQAHTEDGRIHITFFKGDVGVAAVIYSIKATGMGSV